MLIFAEGGKTGEPGEKTLVAWERTTHQTNLIHIWPQPGIEPGPQR